MLGLKPLARRKLDSRLGGTTTANGRNAAPAVPSGLGFSKLESRMFSVTKNCLYSRVESRSPVLEMVRF